MLAKDNKLFVGPVNTQHAGEPWIDSFSHGELIRDGFDETLTMDPAEVRSLFQGVSDKDKAGKGYGQIPWRLGILRLASKR
jgi:hypothetical protein